MKLNFNNQISILNENVSNLTKINEDLENLLLNERKEKDDSLREKNYEILNLNN